MKRVVYASRDEAFAAMEVLEAFGLPAKLVDSTVGVAGREGWTEWEVSCHVLPPQQHHAPPTPEPHENDFTASSWWDEGGPGFWRRNYDRD